MLHKLTLRNFQKHSFFELEFTGRVTVITGPTDSGKSSLIRALSWVCFNRPGGDSFIRDGAKFTKAKLELDDGRTITRKKGRGTNCYYLDGQKFAAMGQSVPEPVSQTLNVDEYNFHSQHDPAFWFSLSPGQVSKELNSIINLGSIDDALLNIGNKVRSAKSAIETTEDRLAKAKERQQGYEWVVEADKSLVRLESFQSRIDARREESRVLSELIADAQKREKAIDRSANAVLALGKAIAIGDKVSKMTADVKTLRKLLDEYKAASRTADIPTPDFSKLESLKLQIEKTLRERQVINSLVDQVFALDKSICRNQKSVEDGLKELNHATKGKSCPLCGQMM